MAQATFLSRIALGASAAVIIGAAALAQTPAARAGSRRSASPFPPTATITTPGYPGVGPADPKLRVVNLPNGKKMHLLPATLDTTQWGWFDNAQPPVLRVKSGDTVVLETMMHSHNQIVPGTTIEQIKKTRTDFPGRGPHTLTGPIYIEEAQPGDVLKVTLNKIVPRAYATNFNVPGMFGQFPTVYSDGQVKYLYLDLDKMTTEFLPGVVLPLRPFPGTIGVARKEPGRYTSVPPGEYAGNMDIRDLVAGTSLYVPVYVPGALLWTGDSHAGQGNGEINLTAIETAYKELNVTVEVIKGKPLDFPRIETAKSWITMGFDQDMNKAWAQAKAQTIKFLSEQRGISAEQAEKLMPTRFRLPRLAGRQRQERHPLPQSQECARQGRHGAPDQRDAEIPSVACQGRRPEQGDERSLDGHDQVARVGKEDRPARRLWTCQRGDGLPGRRDLRHREERPLPDAEEHLGRGRQALTRYMEGPLGAPFRVSHDMVLRSAFSPPGSPFGVAGHLRRSRIQVVTTTTDLRSLAEAVGGDRIEATSLVPANLDAEDYQPKPQDVLRLKNARIVVRVGLDYDLWLDRLLVAGRQARDQARRPRLCRCLFWHRRAGTPRHERRSRRRSCPWQRQSALLARSQECRDHHRHYSRSTGADRSGQCGTITRPIGWHSSRACRSSWRSGRQNWRP